MLELNDEECNKIALGIGISALAVARAMVRAGYAAGYRAAQVVPLPVQDDTGANGEPVYRPKAQAAMPPRDPTQTMIDAGEKRRREIAGRGLCIGTIWRAMYDAWAQEQTSGAGAYAGEVSPASVQLDHQSVAGTNCATEEGARPSPESARGPTADPIADLCMQIRAFLADAPKEMPHEGYRYGELLSFAADALERLAQERDALRECVRAADAMADAYYPDPFHHAPPLTVDAYNAARAKVNTTEGEK